MPVEPHNLVRLVCSILSTKRHVAMGRYSWDALLPGPRGKETAAFLSWNHRIFLPTRNGSPTTDVAGENILCASLMSELTRWTYRAVMTGDECPSIS